MSFAVVVGPRALEDPQAIHRWIMHGADADVADAYLNRIEAACHRLADFPLRGTPRDDLVGGLRTITFEGRATIAYTVTGDLVTILRVLHRGRDLGGAFSGEL